MFIKIRRIFLITIIVITSINWSKAEKPNPFDEVYAEMEDVEDSLFYQLFPFEKCITEDIILNPKLLNDQFDTISKKGKNPKKIIEGILDLYLLESTTDSFSFEDLNRNVTVGEIYSKSNYFINDTSFVFREFGDEMLSKVHDQVETALLNGEVKKNSFEYKFLEKRLLDNKYIIDVPMSNVRKGIMHLKNGNFKYLFNRVWGDYPMICLGLMALSLIIVYLFVKKKINIARK